jgi:cytochrome b561
MKFSRFGFINYSAIAADNEALHSLLLQAHGLTAILLILLFIIHVLGR